jgi:hypothetical protein
MRKLLLVIGAVALLAVAIGTAVVTGHDGRSFEARLSGFREAPAVSSPTGRGTLFAWIEGTAAEPTIRYRLSYSGLGSPATASHIHLGQPNVSGGVSAFLCGGGDKPACPPAGGTVTGVIDRADVIGPSAQGITAGEIEELIRAIRAEVTYVNVHTNLIPSGEIRGNIRHDD